MGKAKEVHWHGLRSFRVVIRRVPESSPQSSSPRHTTTLRPLVEMYPPLPRRFDRLRTAPIYRCGKSKEPWPLFLFESKCVCVCVRAIIESHRNRITHGCRDGRETMVVSFANRCQGGFLCSFPSLGIVIRGEKRSKAFRWFDRGMFYRSIELDNGRASISGERCYDRCSVRFGLYLFRD